MAIKKIVGSLHYNTAGIPGQILTLAGAGLCATLWGWQEALIFFAGGVLGSTRYGYPFER